MIASLDILRCYHLNLKNKITKIEHKKMFCGPSKILKHISWPINICLKYFMALTKTLRLPLRHTYCTVPNKSKKAGQLVLWIWINKTKWENEWCDKEFYLYWIFSVGPDYFFTKNRYSWISHANLAVWWWSSKISSVDMYLFLHVM